MITADHGRRAKGQKEYLKFLDGEKLTRKEAMLAKCYECMYFYNDGKVDCMGYTCPLYQYYPYPSKKVHE